MSAQGNGPIGQSRFRVRYAETDQMGVAYHAHYVVWCDVARTELMRQLGFPYRELEEEHGLFLAVTELEIRYGAPARYDDPIRVEVWIESVQSRAITFGYVIRREDDAAGRRLATARVKLVATARDGSPRRFPSHLRERFREVVQASV